MLLAVLIALCAGYANLSFFVHDRANFRFFPPFQAGYNGNANLHLGAEYLNIARALVDGRGFSDPFAACTGSTAWMPPVYPVLIAALLWLLGKVLWVAAVIVLMQCMVLWLGAYVVMRLCHVVPTRVPVWLPLVFYGAWLMAYFDWFFQMTHDTWIIMLCVELMALGLLRLLERTLSTAEAVVWGASGGLTALTNPMTAVAWGALCVWLLGRRVQPARVMVSSLLIGAAVMNVWTVRNVAVFHRLVLVKSNLAYDFYEGNFGPHSGIYDEGCFAYHPVWTTAAAPNAPYRVLGEVGFIDSYREKIRTALIKQPAEIPVRSFHRLLAATFIYRPYRPAHEGAHPLFASLVHPLPALGAVLLLSLRRRERPAASERYPAGNRRVPHAIHPSGVLRALSAPADTPVGARMDVGRRRALGQAAAPLTRLYRIISWLAVRLLSSWLAVRLLSSWLAVRLLSSWRLVGHCNDPGAPGAFYTWMSASKNAQILLVNP